MATSRRKSPRVGAWRLLSAVPAVLLSSVLVTIASSWLGPYMLLAVASWLLGVPALLWQRGVERWIVRILLRFHPPTGRDVEWLRWLRERSERFSAPTGGPFDWYVVEESRPNAYAAGRRSIAVTRGLLRRLDDGRLDPDDLLAVALHEVGHHVTGGVRHGLAIWWLTWPWQCVHRLTARLGQLLPCAGVGTLLLPVVVAVAICRVVGDGGPPGRVIPVVVVLAAFGLASCVQPLADTAIARAGERAADGYVAKLGAGAALVRARQHLDSDYSDRSASLRKAALLR
jgi:Zn-dependent protease with chaperone function